MSKPTLPCHRRAIASQQLLFQRAAACCALAGDGQRAAEHLLQWSANQRCPDRDAFTAGGSRGEPHERGRGCGGAQAGGGLPEGAPACLAAPLGTEACCLPRCTRQPASLLPRSHGGAVPRKVQHPLGCGPAGWPSARAAGRPALRARGRWRRSARRSAGQPRRWPLPGRRLHLPVAEACLLPAPPCRGRHRRGRCAQGRAAPGPHPRGWPGAACIGELEHTQQAARPGRGALARGRGPERRHRCPPSASPPALPLLQVSIDSNYASLVIGVCVICGFASSLDR